MHGFPRGWLIAAAALLAGCWPISPLPDVDGADRVSFRHGATELNGLYFEPDGDSGSPRPGIVFVPGFSNLAFRSGIDEARHLAGQGYPVLLVSLSGGLATGGVDDCGLTQPDEAVAALEWLGDRDEVDPARLAVMGQGRGGQLALLAAARDSRVRAVVALGPVTRIDRWRETTDHPGIAAWIGEMCESGQGGARRRSPAESAGAIEAPVLLVHGARNRRIPSEQSRLMARALERAGKRVELHLVAGAGNHFVAAPRERMRSLVADFLGRTLP